MIITLLNARKFPLGDIVTTAGVAEDAANGTLSEEFISRALSAHADGKWGDVDEEDRVANDEALRHGSRVLGVWNGDERDSHKTIWIITEADRSVTTILYPEEY